MGDRSDPFLLLSLIVSRSLVQIPLVIMGLLLIEIGDTFNIPVGVTGQMRTTASFLGLASALVMGILSVRFSYKTLLSVGVALFCLSALGSAAAPDFAALLLAYSLTGVGFAMVTSMATALVGELLPVERRSGAMGLILAGNSFMFVCATLVTNYVAGLGDGV